MFYVKHIMAHSLSAQFFESDMKHGIDYDFLIIPQYTIRVKTDDQINEYPPFTAFFFPKGTPYYYAPVMNDEDVYEDCFIQFVRDTSFMHNWFIPAGKPIYLQDVSYIINLAELISFENFVNGPNSDVIIDNLMKTLLLKVYNSIPKTDPIPYRNELYELRQAIFQSPEKQWRLSDIAESLHMSPGYLHSLYKKLFLVTCKQDVITSRLEKAKHLLSYSNQTIRQIAYVCGYNNTEHFCRQFLKMTGNTPSEYRDNHSK